MTEFKIKAVEVMTTAHDFTTFLEFLAFLFSQFLRTEMHAAKINFNLIFTTMI